MLVLQQLLTLFIKLLNYLLKLADKFTYREVDFEIMCSWDKSIVARASELLILLVR